MSSRVCATNQDLPEEALRSIPESGALESSPSSVESNVAKISRSEISLTADAQTANSETLELPCRFSRVASIERAAALSESVKVIKDWNTAAIVSRTVRLRGSGQRRSGAWDARNGPPEPVHVQDEAQHTERVEFSEGPRGPEQSSLVCACTDRRETTKTM